MLKQNVAYFDQQGAGKLTATFASNTDLLHDGITLRLSRTLTALGTLGGAVFVLLDSNWKIAFMLSWSIFLSVTLLVVGNRIGSKYSNRALSTSSSSVDFVEEVFGSIRTVLALGMQRNVEERYLQSLKLSQRNGLFVKYFQGAAVAVAVGVGYLAIALALWQGS